MRSPDGPFRQRRIRLPLPTLLLLCAGVAHAGHITVQLDGIDGMQRDAVMAGLEVAQYGDRDVSAAQARRLYEHAEAQVRKALEPYGYYSVEVGGELREAGDSYTAVLHVTAGEPVKVGTLDLRVDGDADGQREQQGQHHRGGLDEDFRELVAQSLAQHRPVRVRRLVHRRSLRFRRGAAPAAGRTGRR